MFFTPIAVSRVVVVLGLFVFASIGLADEAQVIAELSAKGAKINQARGVARGVQIVDATGWTADDFKKIAQLPHLQSLDVGKGLSDEQLTRLAPLDELAYLSSNAGVVSDDGVKALAKLKKLHTLKFFHPSKAFTGTGLAALADLPELKSVTVAGSVSFGDEGMAAVAKLSHLTEFRCWHAGPTIEGVAKLKSLTSLANLNLGQRLAYKPPLAVSDEMVARLAEMPSLENIQLSEARLSLSALSKLKNLPKLKTLTLDGIQIPEADVQTLTKELPQVKIKWTPPSEAYLKRIKALFPDAG